MRVFFDVRRWYKNIFVRCGPDMTLGVFSVVEAREYEGGQASGVFQFRGVDRKKPLWGYLVDGIPGQNSILCLRGKRIWEWAFNEIEYGKILSSIE